MSAPRAWLITEPLAEAGSRETLPETEGLVVMSRAELAASDVYFRNGERVAITSEAAMDEVLARIDSARASAVRTLKDKVAFREILRPVYPQLTFESVSIHDLISLRLDPELSYVVKPAMGAFGTGVRIMNGDANLTRLQREISVEMERNAAVLSESVLSTDRLIVEQYIEGEEYAADVFFDPDGQPVLTSTYHHPMPANPAYLHMVYYSSARVWDRISGQATKFFSRLNGRLGMRNLAMHAEFRMQGSQLIPIEINAMRFGGMGLGNMIYHALGVNPYRHFIDGTRPDWSGMSADPRAWVFFIAYNGSTVDTTTQRPEWARLRRRFTEIITEVPFDYRSQLAFGILYAREPESRIKDLLGIEFDEMFVPNPRPE